MVVKMDKLSKKLFEVFFHLVLSLMLIDWAVGLPLSFGGIGVYEIAFVLLGCSALVRLYIEKGAIFRNIFCVLRTSKWSAIALIAYLLMGIITLFYAQTPGYALTKYVVVVQMLFFGVCLFYYISGYEKGSKAALKTVYFNIGLSAVFSAIWAIAKYFFFTVDVYPPIISPIVDYNQYTTILLIGLVSIAFFLIKSSLSPVKKYVFTGAVCCVLISAVAVSGSRRSYILVLAVAGLLLIYAVGWEILRMKQKMTTKRRFVAALCGILVCATCVYASTSIMTNIVISCAGKTVGSMGGNLEDSFTPPDPSDPGEEKPDGSLGADRLNDGSGLGKRKIIWRIAIDELLQYDAGSVLFGRGASHSSDIYDNLDDPLVKQLHSSYGYDNTNKANKNWMNAHNLFLQDALDGGLVLLLLQIGVILSSVVYTIIILRKNFTHGLVLGLMFCILLATLVLSSASGIISNKFFWLILTLLMAEGFLVKTQIEKSV